MSGRVCLLTGASGRFGRAFIARHAGDYRIIAVHHLGVVPHPAQDQAFVDPLAPTAVIPTPAPVHRVRTDLADPDEIERLVEAVLGEVGGVDLLINAAVDRRPRPLLAPDAPEMLDRAMRVNALAPIRLSALLGQRLWRGSVAANIAERRSIVNLVSEGGLVVHHDAGQTAEAAAAAALVQATYHLASEFWDIGVRVNAIAVDRDGGPAWIEPILGIIAELDRSDVTGRLTGSHRTPLGASA